MRTHPIIAALLLLLCAIGLGAAIALFRFKLGVLPLLGACAAIGLLSSGLSPLRH